MEKHVLLLQNLAFENQAICLDAYTLVWVLKHKILIYFPFSVKERCLNLVNCHWRNF